MPRTLFLGAAIGAALLLSVTGCTNQPTTSGTAAARPSASQSSPGSSSACGSDPGFCITVDITGSATITGTTTSLNIAGSCAAYVAGGDSYIAGKIPGFLGAQIGGHDVTSVNEIIDYSGPGTYGKDRLRSAAGTLAISLGTTPYLLADASTAEAVVAPDGSGRFTFGDLEEGELGNPTTPKGAISGSITWTCQD